MLTIIFLFFFTVRLTSNWTHKNTHLRLTHSPAGIQRCDIHLLSLLKQSVYYSYWWPWSFFFKRGGVDCSCAGNSDLNETVFLVDYLTENSFSLLNCPELLSQNKKIWHDNITIDTPVLIVPIKNIQLELFMEQSNTRQRFFHFVSSNLTYLLGITSIMLV